MPTRFTLLCERILAASNERPGFFVKYSFLVRFFHQLVAKITDLPTSIFPFFASNSKISFLVIGLSASFLILQSIASVTNRFRGILSIIVPPSTKCTGASRCVPEWELRKISSKLYPSSFLLAHEMNCGRGDPGKLGRLLEISRVRSIGCTKLVVRADNKSILMLVIKG